LDFDLDFHSALSESLFLTFRSRLSSVVLTLWDTQSTRESAVCSHVWHVTHVFFTQ